jgi:hypothetical protein
MNAAAVAVKILFQDAFKNDLAGCVPAYKAQKSALFFW